jgi:predicted GNAT family acetyltransferase
LQIKRFDDPSEYFAKVEDFLLLHEAEHNVQIGVCGQLIAGQHNYQPPIYLACVEKESRIVATAMRTPPFNLHLSVTEDESVVQLFAEDAAKVYDSLPGVLGQKHLCKAFAECWSAMHGISYQLNMQQRLYRLEKVNPVQGVNGELRRATAAAQELLVEWMINFNADALEPISREHGEQIVRNFLTSDLRGLYLWYDGNRPVSMAGATRPSRNGIVIGAVYTPTELRKRGYASACVAALSQLMLDSGRKFCFLFTDLSNPTSNHIYQAIGYEPVSDQDEYRFYEKS